MKRIFLLLIVLAAATAGRASNLKDTIPPPCTDPRICPEDPEMAEIDRMLVGSYLNHYCYSHDPALLNVYGYGNEQIPTFAPEIVASRLRTLDRETPFDLVYNNTVQGFINLYAERRRDITSRVLGMSQLYFPIFEEYLAKYNIPLEMKYLAVVESALNPSVISHAGAGGLWQFMVSTGKMYGLDVTSYQDERYDPYMATDAACRYLRDLYELYDNWELALAAYNSGPGNVNKAIRRSGGKKDFWAIKAFLPKETQGYVPAFIAVNYVMNFSNEYNIYPQKPIMSFFETDTIMVSQRVDFRVISNMTGISLDDLSFLNATYKLKEIPDNGKKHSLILPTSKIGLFLANEESIYAQSAPAAYAEPILTASNKTTTPATGSTKVVWEDGWKTHKVRSGESLGLIADKHNITVAELKKWNKIKGSVIHPGQKLKIRTKVKKVEPVVDTAQQDTGSTTTPVNNESAGSSTATAAEVTTDQKPESPARPETSGYKYYTVQKGDTLWSIANKHQGVTVTSLKSLNGNLSDHRLTVGQKIKIKEIGG